MLKAKGVDSPTEVKEPSPLHAAGECDGFEGGVKHKLERIEKAVQDAANRLDGNQLAEKKKSEAKLKGKSE
eukprot:12609961-Alexandrium_andersonii.AAC.1